MTEERSEHGEGLPELVDAAMGVSAGIFLAKGSLIEPVILYRKEGRVQEPYLVQISPEVLGTHDIRERVRESIRQFVFERGPEELVLVMEGFFVGDSSNARCMSLVYSRPSGERTWVFILGEGRSGPWQEIRVKSGEFYQLYEKSTYRWN